MGAVLLIVGFMPPIKDSTMLIMKLSLVEEFVGLMRGTV